MCICPSVCLSHFWLKLFNIVVSQKLSMGLLLYFTYYFLKTLAIHYQVCFIKKIYFYCKFRRFRVWFFLQNVGVLKLLVKVFKSASNLEMCYWLVFKLHKNILHPICHNIPAILSEIEYLIYSLVSLLIFGGCGLWIYYFYFQVEVFRFVSGCILEITHWIALTLDNNTHHIC